MLRQPGGHEEQTVTVASHRVSKTDSREGPRNENVRLFDGPSDTLDSTRLVDVLP